MEASTPILNLMLQAGLIIALARGLGILIRRVDQPVVVAEIMAGIALGPSLLGWIWPGAMTAVFPIHSLPLLATVSEFGLVLFMFLVGLEFDPRLIRGHGRKSVLISNTSIIVPFVLGIALAYFLYEAYAPETASPLAFALFMGAAMSITAFPVLARILAERQLVSSRVGAISLACAAIGDVTAWCILAFVISIARAEALSGALITTVLAGAYIVFMLVVVRPVLHRLDSRAGRVASQSLLAAATLMLLASAAVTELIGIHALFGGFLLGAVMPREGGLTATLVTRMEDLVVVVLLPLFFAFSGLRTAIGTLDDPRDWAVCGLVVLVAMVGKFGGSTAAARVSGLDWRESGAIGILMNTRGLMELIVLNIGLDLGVLSPQMFTMMVVMALVTTVMTTPLLERLYPRYEMRREMERAVPVAEARPTVMLCVSDAAIAPAMVVLGVALTGRETRRLAALHVLPSDRPSVYLSAAPEVAAGRMMSRVRTLARRLGADIEGLSAVSAQPALEICRTAEVERVELLVLGAHRPVLGRSVFGGVVQEVMRRATVPSGLLVDRGLGRLRRVISATDESASGAVAAELALRLGGDDTIEVTRIEEDGDGVLLRRPDEPAQRFSVTPGEAPAKWLKEALPARKLRRYDLLVLGFGDNGGMESGRPGSDLEKFIEECPVSVLFIHAPPRWEPA
jgi:Kef-type K+ transport system membrane component KefB/nucleotide-binding universal stress UspA family protein